MQPGVRVGSGHSGCLARAASQVARNVRRLVLFDEYNDTVLVDWLSSTGVAPTKTASSPRAESNNERQSRTWSLGPTSRAPVSNERAGHVGSSLHRHANRCEWAQLQNRSITAAHYGSPRLGDACRLNSSLRAPVNRAR